MKQIEDSWEDNAEEWIKAMERGEIGSRTITNPAILRMIFKHKVDQILDAGCGEGWLCRELAHKGLAVSGIDANERLLSYAGSKSEQDFARITFEDILSGKLLPNAPFGGIVLNFCLYLEKETSDLLKTLSGHLKPEGKIFIQTLHPFFLFQNRLSYKDQWVEDSWQGLPPNFKNGHSWFMRTFSGWMEVFEKAGLKVDEVSEPLNGEKNPISIIFVLSKVK